MTSLNDKENLGPLPKNWGSVTLKEVVSKLVDGSHNPPRKKDSGFPMLSARNIKNNQIVFDKFRFISENDFKKEHTRTRIDPGDVLLTIVGTIGRSAVVPAGLKDFTLQRSVAVLTPLKILPKYLMYQLQSPFIQRHFVENARGTAQKGVYLKTLGQTPIRVAPLEQQKRIVAEIEKQFSRLDEAVANLKRVKANLKRYKAAVLKAAVEGKLTREWRKQHPEVEPASKLLERILNERRQKWNGKYKEPLKPNTDKPHEFPASWCHATIDQITLYVSSGSRGWAKYYAESGDIFIRAQNIKHDTLDIKNIAYVRLPKKVEGTRTLIQKDDILITITGANVTKTAHVKSLLAKKTYVSQHVALTRPVFHEISPYLYFWIICPSYGRRNLELAAYGAGKPGLNLNNIRELIVALPPIEEQKCILNEVGRCFDIIEKIEQTIRTSLKRAEHLHQSILHQAFSGQLIEPKAIGEA